MIGIVLGVGIAAVAAWYLIRTSVRVALAFLLATTFLVPGTVLVPGSFSGYTTVHRLVLAIFVLNILRKIARREIPASVLKPSRVSIALMVWVALTFVIGIAMADASYPVGASVFLWVFILEYAVFFLFVLAAARAIDDPWWVARLVATVIVAAAGIAVYEHFSQRSVARSIAKLMRGGGYLGVPPLGRRGGNVRVQSGFEFSLAFAWGATVLLPLVMVVASRARNRLLRLSPAIVVVAIAWTYARSAYVGVAIAALLLLASSRYDRRIAAYVLAGIAAALLFAVGTKAYERTFRSSEVEGSTLVREERLPLILSGAAERPFTGKGLSSVSASGIRTTDSLFLLTYAEIGVIGLAGLGFLLAATAVWVAPAVRAPPPEGLLGAAAFCGILLGIGSAAFLDGFTVSGLARAFWLVAALGVAVAEHARVMPARVPRSARRAWLPAAGVAAGLIVLAVAPSTATSTIRFTTRSPGAEARGVARSDFNGKLLINTTCEIFEARVGALGQNAQCYDLQTGTGVGDIRVEAADGASLIRSITVGATVVRRALPSVRFFNLDAQEKVRPTWVRTAPVWMGLVGLATAVLMPPLPPLRRGRDRRAFPVPAPA